MNNGELEENCTEYYAAVLKRVKGKRLKCFSSDSDNTTQYGIRSIHYSGVRLWNSLPTEIKESRSLPNFRKKLKSHFLLSYK